MLRTPSTAGLPPMDGERVSRGERLDARMTGLGMSDRQLEELSGVNRATIAKARRGKASTGSYDRLERAIEQSTTEPQVVGEARMVTFRISGNFGVDVTVQGPVSDLAALEAAVERVISQMERRNGSPNG